MMITLGIIIVLGGMCALKFYYHNKSQNDKITSLTNQINELKQKNEFIKRCGSGYDYLAIGNSITVHSECNFWWNECGMAATTSVNIFK